MKDRLQITGEYGVHKELFEIDYITATANPEIKEFKCFACDDGTVTYGRGSLESTNGMKTIRINSVEAYRCDNCNFSAHLPAIDDELRVTILRLEEQKT